MLDLRPSGGRAADDRADPTPIVSGGFGPAAGTIGGLSNRAIAGRLFISVKTASVHVSNIPAKLGVSSRTEAAAWSHQHPDVPAISAR